MGDLEIGILQPNFTQRCSRWWSSWYGAGQISWWAQWTPTGYYDNAIIAFLAILGHSSQNHGWQAPPFNSWKLNCDALWSQSVQRGRVSWVLLTQLVQWLEQVADGFSDMWPISWLYWKCKQSLMLVTEEYDCRYISEENYLHGTWAFGWNKKQIHEDLCLKRTISYKCGDMPKVVDINKWYQSHDLNLIVSAGILRIPRRA